MQKVLSGKPYYFWSKNAFLIGFQSLTDAVLGFVESTGRFFIMDMWTTGYLQPILESSQDLSNMEGVNEDGMITLKFTRPRNTGDSQDVAFTNDKGELVLTLQCNQGSDSPSSTIKVFSSSRVLLLEKYH